MKDKALMYKPGDDPIELFSYADWAFDTDGGHSYSRMIIFLSENAIIGHSNKQRSISCSTMEAEYVALANAVKEIMSMNMLFQELQVMSNIRVPCKPYIIWCNNKSAIDSTINGIEISGSKQIDVAYHMTGKKYEEWLISLKYISSQDNVADLFTKGLSYNVTQARVIRLRLLEWWVIMSNAKTGGLMWIWHASFRHRGHAVVLVARKSWCAFFFPCFSFFFLHLVTTAT